MRGANVEWVPGFDHAGIATHTLVKKKIEKASKGSETSVHASFFQKELQDYAQLNRENIRKQLDVLGALLDWNQEYYTLDEVSGAVC
jgi:valyl-tRNA synthetase